MRFFSESLTKEFKILDSLVQEAHGFKNLNLRDVTKIIVLNRQRCLWFFFLK